MTRLTMMDAANYQANHNYVMHNSEHIEAQVYAVTYDDIRYQDLVPLDYSAPEFTDTVSYYSVDAAGTAEYLNLSGNDFPTVDVFMAKQSTTVIGSGIGYTVTMEEAARERQNGSISVLVEKASAARRVAEELLDRDYLFGSPTVTSIKGLFDYPGITKITSPSNGTGSSPLAQDKTFVQINTELNGLLTGTSQATRGRGLANTMVFSLDLLELLTTIVMPDTNETFLAWFRRNNFYTLTTGNELTIMADPDLNTAGAGSTRRTIAYRRAEDVLKGHIPMAFRFLPPVPMFTSTVVPGAQRNGGLDIKKPAEVRYLDGL